MYIHGLIYSVSRLIHMEATRRDLEGRSTDLIGAINNGYVWYVELEYQREVCSIIDGRKW